MSSATEPTTVATRPTTISTTGGCGCADPLLPLKVSHFYRRILGDTLVRKKQSAAADGPNAAAAAAAAGGESEEEKKKKAAAANAGYNRKYGIGSEATTEKGPAIAADTLERGVGTVEVLLPHVARTLRDAHHAFAATNTATTAGTEATDKKNRATRLEDYTVEQTAALLLAAADANTNNTSGSENDKTNEAAVLARSSYIALYFGAAWCPPCRQFTPMLAAAYEKINARHAASAAVRAEAVNSQHTSAAAAANTTTVTTTTANTAASPATPAAEGTSAAAPSSPTPANRPLPPLAPSITTVFVSGDSSLEEAERYFAEKAPGGWLMVPFEAARVRQRLAKRYGVEGYPTLIVLEAATGRLVTDAGAEALRRDEAIGGVGGGAAAALASVGEFPWRKQSVVSRIANEAGVTRLVAATATPSQQQQQQSHQEEDALAKQRREAEAFRLIPPETIEAGNTNNGTAPSSSAAAVRAEPVDIRKLKHFALYFASHASPPCRAFTPLLASAYAGPIRRAFGPTETEIVFVSMDAEEAHYTAQRAQMPWASIPHGHPLIGELVKEFSVKTLPRLVTIAVGGDGNGGGGNNGGGAEVEGRVLNDDARGALAEEIEQFDPNGESSDEEENPTTTAKKTTGYPWARARLPHVAPLVPSADVIAAIKEMPCVILATNRAPNASVLAAAFTDAARLFNNTTATVGGGAAEVAGTATTPAAATAAAAAATVTGYDPDRLGAPDGRRAQFLIADEGHVGSETLLKRLASLLHEALPPAGTACVLSVDVIGGASGGSLSDLRSPATIVAYTERFIAACDAAAAEPSSPLAGAGLLPATTAPRRRPHQQQPQPEGAPRRNNDSTV